MAYYRECPHCGVNLDPGERCDCREREQEMGMDLEAIRTFIQLPDSQRDEVMQMIATLKAKRTPSPA